VSVGIDVERLVTMNRSEWQVLFCPAEIDWLDSLARPEQVAMACALFSAKESYFKCQFPLTRRWLEYQDVELRLGARSFVVQDRNAEPHWRVHGAYGSIGSSDIVATAVVATSDLELPTAGSPA
jgi:4'-phosphopantetheinyl transferase EntD